MRHTSLDKILPETMSAPKKQKQLGCESIQCAPHVSTSQVEKQCHRSWSENSCTCACSACHVEDGKIFDAL